MFGRQKLAMLLAEFFGTALLTTTVLVITHSTVLTFFVAASAAVAISLIVMFFGQVSGAHVNPAVTLGLWTARKIETTQAIAYIAAQLLGGLVSWRLFEYLTGSSLGAHNAKFDTTIWLAELIGAAILAMGFTAAIMRSFDTLQSALAIGSALFIGIMVAGVASAGYLNPAIALGARSWGSAYVFGPLVGGILGVNLYMLIFSPEALKPQPTKAKTRVAAASSSTKKSARRKKK